jgi:sporulation integral membrane protein YtvI
MHRAEIEKYLNIMLKIVVASLFLFLIYVLFKVILAYFMPFIIAFLLSLIIEPLVRLFQRLKISRGISVFLSIIVFLGLFAAFSAFAVTRVIFEFTELYERLPNYYNRLYNLATQIVRHATDIYVQLAPEVVNITQDAVRTIFRNITEFLSRTTTSLINTATTLPSKLVFLIITLISTFFITKDKYVIKEFIFRQLPETWGAKITTLKTDLFSALIGFLKAQLIILTITFVESFIGLSLIGVDYAFTLAIIIALVDILPVLGTGGIYVPWGIVNLALGNYGMAISLLVLYGVITVVRYMIEPKIVGKQLGIHPLATLISMFAGLKLIGVAGLILGPTTIVALKACQHAGILPKFK